MLTCFGFGFSVPPKSGLGGVLGRLGASWGVLERLAGVLGASWSALERLRAVLERLGSVLGASWAVLEAPGKGQPPPTRQQPAEKSR